MGEANTVNRTQRERDWEHLRGMSDDMVGQNRNGTWETLAGPEQPNTPLGRSGAEPSYKETKEREAQQGDGWSRST